MEWFTINSYYFIPLWAFLLDCILGDPRSSWHPVVLIGRVISSYEKLLYHKKDSAARQLISGAATVILTLFTVTAIGFLLLMAAGTINFWLAYVVQVLIVHITISPRSLAQAGAELAGLLARKNLDKARERVGWIVGRDTTELDEGEITRATIETIAENTVDGIVSPLIFFAFFGPLGALFYRTANTMDSMLGYKNERYLYFGRVAARFDDLVNFIPARITLFFYIIAARLTGHDAKNAWRIARRDARKHPSPNGGYAEAPVAGALHIRLGGFNKYGDRMTFRAYMGDADVPMRGIHIKKTIGMMYICTVCAVVTTMIISKAVVMI